MLYLSLLAIITHSIASQQTPRAAAPREHLMTEPPKLEDLDPVETREWLESIDSVLKTHGPERAHYLLERLIDYTRRSGAYLPFKPNTAYVNTIPTGRQPDYPGNRALERRIEAYIRWNALAMVLQANKVSSEYGGHLSSYASSATLYEVGFNHFWRAPSEQHPGDLVFIQGHSSPGIYARAYLEGRLSEELLRHFRQEAGGPGLLLRTGKARQRGGPMTVTADTPVSPVYSKITATGIAVRGDAA